MTRSTTTFLIQHALFTTRQFAVLCNLSVGSASRTLGRLADQANLVRVTRGIWAQPAHPSFTPFAAVPLLIGNEHGYVSFLSALHRHGIVSQIPGSVQVATTGHTRALCAPIGRFEFMQVKPHMMATGIETSATNPPYAIASAEKALLDTLYISSRKGRRFARLPELDLDDINRGALFALLDQQVLASQVHRAIATRLLALGVQRH